MTLTREEILAKKPGKELNEHVMQHIFNMKKDPEGDSFTWVYKVDEEILDWQPSYFSPSTNISAAWEVVEKADIVEISKSYRAGGMWYWVASVKGVCIYAKTVPEAVCKAALLAVLNL